jgi:hypothetical protein
VLRAAQHLGILSGTHRYSREVLGARRNKCRLILVWNPVEQYKQIYMGRDLSKIIVHNHSKDGIDRRGFLDREDNLSPTA